MTDLAPTRLDLSATPANAARYYVLLAATAVGLLLLILLNPATIDGRLNPLFQERGFIEKLSPIGYLFCIVLIIAQGGFRFAFSRALALTVILFAMTLRELDFHTRFTVMSMEKLKFYISSSVPLEQKAIGLLVLLLLAAALVLILKRHAGPFMAGLARGDPVSLATLFAIVSVALSKSIDGLNNRLADLGFSISGEATHFVEKIEETAELGVPLFLLVAIIAYFGSAREGGRSPR
jgi:hypothetical protein